MREIEQLKEEILKEYPRLDLGSEFTFACHPGVPCFNECCGDVNIFLTPYDVIRLKNALGITSAEFLSKYTIAPFDKNLKFPVVMFKMNEDEKKTCQFLGSEGCTVYENRPWACRMYPLGMASHASDDPSGESDFYFLLKENVCKGWGEAKKQTVRAWLADQEIEKYNEMGEDFKDLTLHSFFQKGGDLPPQKIEMFFMACYNLDHFRDFLFGSTFFDKFEVPEETKAELQTDDQALLKFGCRWLRFALFGEETLTVKAEVFRAKQEAQAKMAAASKAAIDKARR